MAITVDLEAVGGVGLLLHLTDDLSDHPDLWRPCETEPEQWVVFQDTAGNDITMPPDQLGAMIRMIREFARRKGIPIEEG